MRLPLGGAVDGSIVEISFDPSFHVDAGGSAEDIRINIKKQALHFSVLVLIIKNN